MASTLAIAMRQAQLRERVELYANELEDRVAARTADLERSENRLSAILNALPDLRVRRRSRGALPGDPDVEGGLALSPAARR